MAPGKGLRMQQQLVLKEQVNADECKLQREKIWTNREVLWQLVTLLLFCHSRPLSRVHGWAGLGGRRAARSGQTDRMGDAAGFDRRDASNRRAADGGCSAEAVRWLRVDLCGVQWSGQWQRHRQRIEESNRIESNRIESNRIESAEPQLPIHVPTLPTATRYSLDEL
jgi:hypothetical protein